MQAYERFRSTLFDALKQQCDEFERSLQDHLATKSHQDRIEIGVSKAAASLTPARDVVQPDSIDAKSSMPADMLSTALTAFVGVSTDTISRRKDDGGPMLSHRDDSNAMRDNSSCRDISSLYTQVLEEKQELERQYDLMSRQAAQYRKAYHQAKDKLQRYRQVIQYQKECQALWEKHFGNSKQQPSRPNFAPQHEASQMALPELNIQNNVFGGDVADPDELEAFEEAHHCKSDAAQGFQNIDTANKGAQKPSAGESEPVDPSSAIISSSVNSGSNVFPIGPDNAGSINVNDTALKTPSDGVSTQFTDKELSDRPGNHTPRSEPDADDVDDPIFVSSRCLKRKRVTSKEPNTNVCNDSEKLLQDGSPEKPYHIKREEFSSPTWPAHYPLVQTESLDLDEVTGAVDTPRKRKHLQSLMSIGQIPSIPFLMNCYDAPDTPIYSCNPKKPSSGLESTTHMSNTGTEAPQALQPLSVNQRSLPRTTIYKPNQRCQIQEREVTIGVFAEDGEYFGSVPAPVSFPFIKSDSTTAATNDTKKRIGTLLERRLPEQQPLKPPPRSPRHITSEAQPCTSKTTYTLHPNEDQHSARISTSHIKKPGLIQTITTSICGPLRQRPLDRLSLEDFKINPSRNHGYDYAYDDVVRGREKRRCLPNCTRKECCGDKFSKIVEIGGPISASKGLWESSQETEEERMVKEFLGDDHARLKRMNEEEKADILRRARVQQFAANHGKHKQVHQRQSSPPGFWRTGMPSTQEMEQDRQLSMEQQRHRIKERYEEAMRPNGRWRFRDE